MSTDSEEHGNFRRDKAIPDEVFLALHGLRTELVFMDEYRGQFEALRDIDPERAEDMLFHLRGTTGTAVDFYNKLVDLLLAGKTITCGKHLPRELRLTRILPRPPLE